MNRTDKQTAVESLAAKLQGARSIYVTDPNRIVFEATPAVEMPASSGPDASALERIRRWSAE